jgi:hypothetical protein
MQIIRVLNNRYTQGKYWSKRNKTSSKKKILKLLSGNELINMIRDILSEEELSVLSQKYPIRSILLKNLVRSYLFKKITMILSRNYKNLTSQN